MTDIWIYLIIKIYQTIGNGIRTLLLFFEGKEDNYQDYWQKIYEYEK